ncbi:acyltransferase [Conexibacter sp. DBS9H8]|uniref:acyltransferase family protein n=1 Tax=Conexibacter sp. DBS9H8 TaxID=2937801 RepID=UPI00201002C8|nr:acyltransferase [Conexibacter sp. DBS9H8]
MSAESPDPQRRVGALDGLRGWAALIVVFSHVFNASLIWYNPPGIEKWPEWSGRWWIVQTPLHLIWAGPEMVLIFFVLSGYVLTLPYVIRGVAALKLSYYPRRLVRLYLPALAALLFAAVLHHIPGRAPQPGAGVWLNEFAVPETFSNGLRSASLLSGTNALNAYTTVLWSMRWEVIFSMLLPLIALATLLTRRVWPLALIIACACAWSTSHFAPSGTFFALAGRYLPIFVIGSLMAVHLPPERVAPRGHRTSPGQWLSTALIPVCLLALTAGYWTVNEDGGSAVGWPERLIVLGAVLAVWLALSNRIVIAFMSSRVSRWLGHRSYSLYLIHQPIVISIAFAFGGKVNTVLLAALSVPLALLAADLLWRLVEHPTINLSRRVGTGTDALLARLAVLSG